MVQSLQLGGTTQSEPGSIGRVNRLPLMLFLGLVVVFFAVIIYGLSSRGLYFRASPGLEPASTNPASTYADQLKRGISDAVIGEPAQPLVLQPTPVAPEKEAVIEAPATSPLAVPAAPDLVVEREGEWRLRIEREHKEQYLREQHRQQLARLQARAAALDSPLVVDMGSESLAELAPGNTGARFDQAVSPRSPADLYTAALQSGVDARSLDPNAQMQKNDFFNQDIRDLGYLAHVVVPPQSPYELKRGSVIPATLISGINSDLPGRILAQVSQPVFDSATGHLMLLPQGTRLFGRYDSSVSFGQSRVLVVWTDIILPNGATLQIEGMAGTDGEGYGGFKDKVDRHTLRTFGSAALLALIGAGIDMSVPESSTLATRDTASDAARRSFAETFGRVVDRTISKGLDVQPTLQIRPGYKFNILVEQDIVFPGPYRVR